jgi:hypothetical protein
VNRLFLYTESNVLQKTTREKRVSKKTKDNLSELYEILFAAWDCYQLWWIVVSKEGKNRYWEIFWADAVFFETASYACFTTVIVNLYKLYEARKDTVNINGLLKDVKRESVIDEEKMKCLRKRFDIAKETWKKISVLRSNWFAHQSNAKSRHEIFKTAKITPNQIEAFIKETGGILNATAEQLSVESRPFNDSVERQTQILFEKLKSKKK